MQIRYAEEVIVWAALAAKNLKERWVFGERGNRIISLSLRGFWRVGLLVIWLTNWVKELGGKKSYARHHMSPTDTPCIANGWNSYRTYVCTYSTQLYLTLWLHVLFMDFLDEIPKNSGYRFQKVQGSKIMGIVHAFPECSQGCVYVRKEILSIYLSRGIINIEANVGSL